MDSQAAFDEDIVACILVNRIVEVSVAERLLSSRGGLQNRPGIIRRSSISCHGASTASWMSVAAVDQSV
jgi:hypothetical protein